MRRFIFITIIIISLYDVSAQIRIESGGAPDPVRLRQKAIYDSAQVTVFYDYGCAEPPINGSPSRKYSEVILLIGDKYLGTMDWRSFQMDSINDDYYLNKRGTADDLLMMFFNNESLHPAYKYPVVVDLNKNEAILVVSTSMTGYRYRQSLPRIEWKLENEEKKIKGIRCLKATCRFGGRDWTAWYAPEYAMPYGPYLFNGLPGLIMQVVDKKKNFAFKFKGIERCNPKRCIYLEMSKTLDTTREKAREAVKNFNKDPMKALIDGGAVKVPKGSPLGNISSSIPYNPIELE